MVLSEAVKQLIVEKGIESEEKVFINHQDSGECITITETGGGRPNAVGTLFYPSLQIRTRYEVNSHKKILEIYKLLNSLSEEKVGNFIIDYCSAMGSSPDFLLKQGAYNIYTCNFTFLLIKKGGDLYVEIE